MLITKEGNDDMAKILFNNNVDLCGFNLDKYSSDTKIPYPNNPNNPEDVEQATENSIAYSFVNNVLSSNESLYGRYKSSALSRDTFIIYRQAQGDNTKKYVGIISGVQDGFYDYDISSGQAYRYIVESSPVPSESEMISSVSLETECHIHPYWKYWSICDIEKNIDASNISGKDIYVPSDTVFILKNNVKAGSISDNLNIIKYDTLGQYGKVIQNYQKYDSGNISCMTSDFIACQDIRFFSRILVVDDDNIKNEAGIQSYFASFKNNNNDFHEDLSKVCFIFPKVSDIYYKYQENNPIISYEIVDGQDQPDNWRSHWNTMYYVKQNNLYSHPQHFYGILEEKPVNWETEYGAYYLIDIDDDDNIKYVINTDKQWEPNRYYEKLIPTWEEGKYYIQIVNEQDCGVQIPDTHIFMNVNDSLIKWRECLSNGKLKLLKSPNGQSWVVSISDKNTLEVQYDAPRYPSTINFTWQEVLDKDQISIIKW